ncbi:hypothetical protein ACI798_06135 [Geodermatophilus sp. SYSU D01045]
MGLRIGTGVLAALVAGASLGAVSRALMSLVSLAASGSSTFSWSGTSFVLLLHVLVAVPGGAVAGLTVHRLRWLLPVAGALFLCLPAVGVAAAEVGATAGFGALQWLGVVSFGSAVFATIGLLPVLTVRLTDRWLGRRRAVDRGGSGTAPEGTAPAALGT